jgi:hypothetical protein
MQIADAGRAAFDARFLRAIFCVHTYNTIAVAVLYVCPSGKPDLYVYLKILVGSCTSMLDLWRKFPRCTNTFRETSFSRKNFRFSKGDTARVNGVLPPPPNVSDQATSGQKLEETILKPRTFWFLTTEKSVFFVRLAVCAFSKPLKSENGYRDTSLKAPLHTVEDTVQRRQQQRSV